MNKKAVNDQLDIAYQAIIDKGIAKISDSGEYIVYKEFRRHISRFGAAITTGSLKSAIAFFSYDGNASVSRSLLIKAIECILERRKLIREGQTLFNYAENESTEAKENIINAAIAIKLALNLFIIVDKE